MSNWVLGFCSWDVLAAIALGAAIAVLIVQQLRHKERMEDLKNID